jgi:PAS domain-containing protein
MSDGEARRLLEQMFRGEVVRHAAAPARRCHLGWRGARPLGRDVGVPVTDGSGRSARVVMLTQDISDRMPQRRRSAKRGELPHAPKRIPQMVWSTRPDGYHDFYNDRWYEFTGTPYGSTDGEGWNGMFHPDDQDRAWSAWRASLVTGEPYEIDYRLRHRSGAYRWVLGRALPIRPRTGRSSAGWALAPTLTT